MDKDKYDYVEAFSRNIGWVSKKEQFILKNKTVAIAGVGGVGGFHLLTLCRLGIENFHIADPDTFELANFNRQVGATMSSLHKSKTQTLYEMAKDINPQVQIKIFGAITQDNVDDFLSGTDIYVDGMDFFCLDTRELLFLTCEKMKIPAVTAGPLGISVCYLIFDGKGMSFRDYFQLENKSEKERLVNFMMGLAPTPLHLSYLVDSSTFDLDQKKGPSTIMACMLCAGVAGTQVLKILLKRGKVYAAPYYNVFDAYSGRHKRGYLRWGNKNPLQRIKKAIVLKVLAKEKPKPQATKPSQNLVEKILDLARWAPSGDNSQPWRFKIESDNRFFIIVENPLENSFYDFAGKPTWISIGCLIETLQLAANKFDKRIQWVIKDKQIEVQIEKKKENTDPYDLAAFIEFRSVDRGHYQKEKPPADLFNEMNHLLNQDYQLSEFSDPASIRKIIKMNQLATQVRLVLEKAHLDHQRTFKFKKSDAELGIPAEATGLSNMSILMMKFLLNHWKLLYFLNRKLGFATLASFELDYLPGKNSAGYFALTAAKSIDSMSETELIEAGMQIQRLWLYLTKKGLVIQPCYITIILSYYLRNHIPIENDEKILEKMNLMKQKFKELGLSDKTIFIARFGYEKFHANKIRSTRLPIEKLILK